MTEHICAAADRLLLQFHITGRCNLRCKHCYRTEGDVEPLTTEQILDVIRQFLRLQRRYQAYHHTRRRGHINITGGEPFIREDMEQILDFLGSHRQEISFGILSNGSFLDDHWVRVLKRNDVSFVQLSIDGDEATHDALRAPGDFRRTFRTAAMLEKRGIRTYISFTANRENFRHLPKVAALCRRKRITKLWTDRLVPIGNGSDLENLAITGDFLPGYLEALKKAQGGFLAKLLFPKTQVTANRALQFLGADGAIYSCSAGNTLITVDEFGRVMPCRRMPIICGNVLETSLEEIYYQNETFKNLRKPAIPKECAGCVYSQRCRGGAKCQSYGCYGSWHRKDPGCPEGK